MTRPLDNKRIFQLDVLRGFAILMVMGVHVPAYPLWSTFGGWGVDLFFVLSGFLISNLLFKEYQKSGDIRLVRFLSRRALKLYPSFYLLVAVTLIYCYFWNVPVSGRSLVGELSLTQNYIGSVWGHTWSLSVEEHFYLALPLLLALLLRRRPGSADPFRPIPYICLGVAVSCLALRIVNALQHPVYSHGVFYEPSHLRVDSLFFGVFLSYMHNFRSAVLRKLLSNPYRLPFSWVSVLAFVPAFFLPANDPIVYTVGFTCVYVGFGTMLLLSLYKEVDRKRAEPGLALRSIAWMGTYSYTLYLWHVPLAQLFAFLAPKVGMVNQYELHAVYFVTCIVIGVVTTKMVEIPVLKFRERFFPATEGEKVVLTAQQTVTTQASTGLLISGFCSDRLSQGFEQGTPALQLAS
jgi:peptidoglycan/LPS O-acetylase OafA/YrhL